MNIQHKDLAKGRWRHLNLIEQMANIGSEVERFINWRIKNNEIFAQKAFERALELFDLTIDQPLNFYRLKEISRARESVAELYEEKDMSEYSITAWKKYFSHFTYAARRNR